MCTRAMVVNVLTQQTRTSLTSRDKPKHLAGHSLCPRSFAHLVLLSFLHLLSFIFLVIRQLIASVSLPAKSILQEFTDCSFAVCFSLYGLSLPPSLSPC